MEVYTIFPSILKIKRLFTNTYGRRRVDVFFEGLGDIVVQNHRIQRPPLVRSGNFLSHCRQKTYFERNLKDERPKMYFQKQWKFCFNYNWFIIYLNRKKPIKVTDDKIKLLYLVD